MASEIKNQNVTDNEFDNELRERCITLRKDRHLYRGLDRGSKAAADLVKIERVLEIRTGRTW